MDKTTGALAETVREGPQITLTVSAFFTTSPLAVETVPL